jgi:hypothetical protein
MPKPATATLQNDPTVILEMPAQTARDLMVFLGTHSLSDMRDALGSTLMSDARLDAVLDLYDPINTLFAGDDR